MYALVREIVDTFEAALGPFADPAVMRLAQGLPKTLERPDQLRVLMQGHRRTGVQARAALVTVVADHLVIATPDGPVGEWALAGCTVGTDEPRIGGLRLTITTPEQTVVLHQAMPVDEAPRLIDAIASPSRDAALGLDGNARPFSDHPPVARLGAAAVLYDDRIAFADAPTRPLSAEVRARALALPSHGTALRSVSRLMQGAHGRPRQVLVDGPGWSEIAAAPETSPERADAFADAVNRWATR